MIMGHHISNLSLQIFKIFLKSVTLGLITHPYNPKYSRLQNQKKSKLNSEKIWKLWKKGKLNSKKIWTIWKLNLSDDIIQSSSRR
jgi:hypothetical protein